MKNFFKEMFSSGGKVSSKRVVTIIAFIIMTVGFMVDLFTDKTVSENVFTAMEYIVIAGLGFTASERFSKYTNNNQEQS